MVSAEITTWTLENKRTFKTDSFENENKDEENDGTVLIKRELIMTWDRLEQREPSELVNLAVWTCIEYIRRLNYEF